MDAKTYLKVSAVNLLFLVAGTLVGPVAVKSFDLFRVVHAQSENGVKGAAAKADAPKPPNCDENKYECVSPGMTIGAGGFYQVLAHQVAADQVLNQGIDLLKLHENTLNLLRSKNIASPAEIQKVVDDAKVARPLRLR